MNKGVALIGGVGLGATLMYMFDPDRGKRRRALVQDKVIAAGHKAEDLTGKMTRDVRNRIYCFLALLVEALERACVRSSADIRCMTEP